jgi:broad specificity phosphatase PhoE
MKLYFVRHGQSEANISRVISNRGWVHPLTEKGLQQAHDLAARLAEARPIGLVCLEWCGIKIGSGEI